MERKEFHRARHQAACRLTRRALALGGVGIVASGHSSAGSTSPLLARETTPAVDHATPADSADVAGMVTIEGRQLYRESRGEGNPLVVLEAGYRSPALVWTDDLAQPDAARTMTLPGVAAFTQGYAYDRPGVAALLSDGLHPSRSEPVPMPRSITSVVEDLHAILDASSIPGPYVLVGHSLGGIMVRLYAATWPDDVAGMVLVDAWYEGLEELLTPTEWAAYMRINIAVPPELATYSELETIDFGAASSTMRQAAGATPIVSIPLVVLSHGQPFGIPMEQLGFSPDALEHAWTAAQEELAGLVPNAHHIIAMKSGHYIQIDQPELVIEAIRQVVEAVRDPGSWIATR